jgi:Putative Flp pilus-assembly TadE/G-like
MMMRVTAHPKRGQTLPIFVLALTVLLGFAAMAIDVGLLYEDRRHMRKPGRRLPVMTADRLGRLEGRDYLPSDPERVKRGQANSATTIALLLGVCVIAFFVGLVLAMEIGRFN